MIEVGAFAPRKNPQRWQELVAVPQPRATNRNREPTWARDDHHCTGALSSMGNLPSYEEHHHIEKRSITDQLVALGCTLGPDGRFRESYAIDLAIWLYLTAQQRFAACLYDWSKPQDLPLPQHYVPRREVFLSEMDQLFGYDENGELVQAWTAPTTRWARWEVRQWAVDVPDDIEEDKRPRWLGDNSVDDIESARVAAHEAAYETQELWAEDGATSDEVGLCPVCHHQLPRCLCVCDNCGLPLGTCDCSTRLGVSAEYLEQDDAPLILSPAQLACIKRSMNHEVAEDRIAHEHQHATRPHPRTAPVSYREKVPYDIRAALAWEAGQTCLPKRGRGRPMQRPRRTPYPGCVWLYERTDQSWQARAFWQRFPWGIPRALIGGKHGWWAWIAAEEAILDRRQLRQERTRAPYQVPRRVMEQALRIRRQREADALLSEMKRAYPEMTRMQRRLRLVLAMVLWSQTQWIPPEELLPEETGLWLATHQVADILGQTGGAVSKWHQRQAIPTDKNGVKEHHYRLEDVIQRANELANVTDRHFPRPPTRPQRIHPGAA